MLVLKILRNALKTGKPLSAVVNCISSYNFGFCYILIWLCWYLLVELFLTIL